MDASDVNNQTDMGHENFVLALTECFSPLYGKFALFALNLNRLLPFSFRPSFKDEVSCKRNKSGRSAVNKLIQSVKFP